MNNQDFPRCTCGQIIYSGKIRDFYMHVMQAHPDMVIPGVRCHLCEKVIPGGLITAHQFIDHHLRPPVGLEYNDDMERDYKVLQLMKSSNLKITEAGR